MMKREARWPKAHFIDRIAREHKPMRVQTPPAAVAFRYVKRVWLATALPAVYFVLTAVSFVFLALRWTPPALGVAGAVALALIISFAMRSTFANSDPRPRRATRYAAVVIAAGVLWIGLTLSKGYAMSAGDPVVGPTLARTILSGELPLHIYPRGSSAYAYPPGYPILLAPLMGALDSVTALGVIKILTTINVGLIPAAWGWMMSRVFVTSMQAWQVQACSYAAFLMFERTLGFAVPFAGKNAVLLALLLAPAVFVFCVQLASTRFAWLGGVIALFGLTLIHYTMLHMLAALLGAYAVLGLVIKRLNWVQILRLALMGAGAAAFMLVSVREALADPRAGGLAFHPEGFGVLANILVSWKSMIVIFADQNFGMTPAPLRGLALIACTAFSCIVGQRCGTADLTIAALVFFASFIISLAFAVGLIPAGLNADFARWYLWAIQATIFMIALLAGIKLIGVLRGRQHVAALACAGVIIAFQTLVMLRDGYVEYRYNNATSTTRGRLTRMTDLLERSRRANSPCWIIGESNPGMAMVIQQTRPVWNYAEATTPCQYINGSWTQPGQPGGRAADGFPSVETLARVSEEASVFFVGTLETFRRYDAYLREASAETHWEDLGETAQANVWLRRPRPRS